MSQMLRRSPRHRHTQSQSGTYQTRSRSQTLGNARAPPGLNTTRSTTSTNEIRGLPKRKAEEELDNTKKKLERAKTQKEKADESLQNAMTLKEAARDTARDLVSEGMKGLDAILQSVGMATNESDARKVAGERVRANTNTDGTMKLHPMFNDAYDALGIEKRGMSLRGSRKSKRYLPFDHPAALPGQQFGHENLSEEKVRQKEYHHQYRNGTGDIVGFSNEYRPQAYRKRWDIDLQRGDSLAGHTERKKLHLKKVIPNACIKRPEFLSKHEDNKGFDILPLTGPLKK